ncbi:MAG: ABC transporter ATP-binding protein, partial [Chlamydiia bacterium]|nr:ABC transporter ATP-binding protein [Chlamydiia bacterium]
NAKIKARRVRIVLRQEKRDIKAIKKQTKKIEIADKKSGNLNISSTKEVKLYLTNHKEEIKLKRAKILKEKGQEAAVKYDEKVEEKNTKERIKYINKLNSSSKGQRLMPNSGKDILIDVVGLRKSYTGKSLIFDALKDVNLTIKRGEFVVILGPSGSGKSTLLNMISGLDRPTNGDIIIGGHNICALKESELTRFRRDQIGFVFQSYNLMSTLNVKDNVEIGRSLQKDRTLRLDSQKLLTEMGIAQQSAKRTFELSGGQQQRVSIARALSKSPSILIGDEPTGALDTQSGIEVLTLFKKINKDNKTTIIIVTHDKNLAHLADKVIYVKDAQINKILINKKPKPAS